MRTLVCGGSMLALLCSGCTRTDPYHLGPTVSVEGIVRVDGQPVRIPPGGYGRVYLHPDAAKGNTCPQPPFGDIDAQGRYRVRTRGQDGAPPGWYRVEVVARGPSGSANLTSERASLVSQKYGDPRRSGLTLNVLTEPRAGGYDLELRK